jgi:hypothetical protein
VRATVGHWPPRATNRNVRPSQGRPCTADTGHSRPARRIPPKLRARAEPATHRTVAARAHRTAIHSASRSVIIVVSTSARPAQVRVNGSRRWVHATNTHAPPEASTRVVPMPRSCIGSTSAASSPTATLPSRRPSRPAGLRSGHRLSVKSSSIGRTTCGAGAAGTAGGWVI